MSIVISVANQKGGVAKTTTVVSLAGALVQRGMDVLAIDLDAQANMTLALGSDPNKVRGSVSDVLLNSTTISSVIRETNIPGLSLVPASSEMELAERFLSIRHNYEQILRLALNSRSMPNIFDYVLLDCPPSMGAVTLNAMVAAQMLVIPTQPEFFSAHALRSMMTTIRRVRSQYNPQLMYRILITLRDRRNRIHRNLTDQIQTTFGEGVFETVIDTDTKLRESTIAGLPINFYRSKTRSTFQYAALAEELIENVQETIAKPA
jgi:chromosome partitioning protein